MLSALACWRYAGWLAGYLVSISLLLRVMRRRYTSRPKRMAISFPPSNNSDASRARGSRESWTVFLSFSLPIHVNDNDSYFHCKSCLTSFADGPAMQDAEYVAKPRTIRPAIAVSASQSGRTSSLWNPAQGNQPRSGELLAATPALHRRNTAYWVCCCGWAAHPQPAPVTM